MVATWYRVSLLVLAAINRNTRFESHHCIVLKVNGWYSHFFPFRLFSLSSNPVLELAVESLIIDALSASALLSCSRGDDFLGDSRYGSMCSV
jgi:hypothetical protein